MASDIKLAHLIAQAAKDAGIGFRNSYSGRAMYGRTCIAVTGSMDEIQKIVSAVAGELVDLVFEAAIDSDDNTNEAYATRDEIRDMMDQLTKYNWDSMGLDTVVYWRKIESISEDEMCKALGLPTDEELEQKSPNELLLWIRRYGDGSFDGRDEDHDTLVEVALRIRDRVIEGKRD